MPQSTEKNKREIKFEKKFFRTFLGCSPHENEHVSKTFKTDEMINFTRVDKFLLKCDSSTRSKVKGTKNPVFVKFRIRCSTRREKF